MSAENRLEPRTIRNIGIFAHVHSCDEMPELVGVSIPCNTTDFSLHGLQCNSDVLLPKGSLINNTVGIGHPFAMYLLLGEIRWVHESEEEMSMGVSLMENEASDFERWLKDFDTIFAKDGCDDDDPAKSN